MINKKNFTVKTEDGNELELSVKRPTAEIRSRAQLIFNKAFREAIDAGSILQRQLSEYATKLGLWSEAKDKEVEELQQKLRDAEIKLRGEANNFDSKEEARDFAFQMKELRWKLINTQSARNNLYPVTAESYADEARERFFVSQCTLNQQGKPYFKSYEDFLSQSDSEVGVAAHSAYIDLIYSDVGSIEDGWVENQWLKKYGYVDEKNRAIDPVNKWLIDISTGKRISEQGTYLTDDGKPCDREGNLLDEDGNYLVSSRSFD